VRKGRTTDKRRRWTTEKAEGAYEEEDSETGGQEQTEASPVETATPTPS